MASGIHLIGMPFASHSASGLSTFNMNGSTDVLSVMFRAEEAMAITRLGYRYHLRTGTPPTYIGGLEGVDASGNPDGVYKGGGSPASQTFTPPADTTWNTTWRELTLANAYTCTRGELLAWTLRHSSGTIDGSNFSSFATSWNPYSINFPYPISNDAGTPTRAGVLTIYGYGSASKVYGNPLINVLQTSTRV